jgi:hypothetical protein
MTRKNEKSIMQLFDAYVEKMTDGNWDKFVSRLVVAYSGTHGDWDLMSIVDDMVHLRRFHGSGLTSWDTVDDVRCALVKYGLVRPTECDGRAGWINVGSWEHSEERA